MLDDLVLRGEDALAVPRAVGLLVVDEGVQVGDHVGAVIAEAGGAGVCWSVPRAVLALLLLHNLLHVRVHPLLVFIYLKILGWAIERTFKHPLCVLSARTNEYRNELLEWDQRLVGRADIIINPYELGAVSAVSDALPAHTAVRVPDAGQAPPGEH